MGNKTTKAKAPVARKAAGPVRKAAVGSVPGETIMVPYLGNINDIRAMPIPASGMDRAQWYANDLPNADVRSNAIRASSSSSPRIGMNQRGIGGPVRGSEWTDGYYTGFISVTLPTSESRETDSLSAFWSTQIGASKGLNVPGEDKVYVNKDTQSVWA